MNEYFSYTLKDVLEIIKKRIWVLIIITVLCSIAGGILSIFIIAPIYETKTSIIIGKNTNGENNSIQYDEVLMYQKIVSTYMEIAKSRLVAEKTISLLGKNTSPDELLKRISVSSKEDTQILVIKYQSNNAEDAMNTLNKFSSVLIEASEDLLPTGNAKIVDRAVLPEFPLKPNPKLYIIFSFVLGMIISLSCIFTIDYFDNTLKTEEDVEMYAELPLLGIIPRQIK